MHPMMAVEPSALNLVIFLPFPGPMALHGLAPIVFVPISLLSGRGLARQQNGSKVVMDWNEARQAVALPA
jgi:hypothetical protein